MSLPVNYTVQWYTQGIREPVFHTGNMIGILPKYSLGTKTQAIIIEINPPNETPGTYFKEVDLELIKF